MNTPHDPPEGNPYLRSMSVMKARAVCKADLMNNAEAQARYAAYVADEPTIKSSYSAEYRGVQQGGRNGRAE